MTPTQSRSPADEIEHLKSVIRRMARNDGTFYAHHERRLFDARKPMDAAEPGSIWLTPREIARAVLGEPDLATLSDDGA